MHPENDYLVYFMDGQTKTRAYRVTADSAREAALKVLESRNPEFLPPHVGKVVTISLQTYVVHHFHCSRHAWTVSPVGLR